MKKFLIAVIFILVAIFTNAQGFDVKFSQPNYNEYGLSFKINDWSLKNIELNGINYEKIIFSSSTFTEKKGWAELPYLSAAIQLPANKNVEINVINSNYTDYQLDYPLIPSRGIIYRNQNPDLIPYEIDPASIINSFYPESSAIVNEPFIIRDIRGTSVNVYPFQYNSSTNTLRVFHEIEVILTENNELATNPLLKSNNSHIREAEEMYKRIFLNYSTPKVALSVEEYGEILVITTPRDSAAINDYITWKREKGFIVYKEVVATGTMVKTNIQNFYNAHPNLLYVQLVGDWADIKSEQVVDNSPTDPKMGCVSGTDNFPDIAIGRFSCSNTQQLAIQINKTIQYERNPDMDDNWRESFIGIGSSEGNGIGDDGEVDYLHIQRIYTQRLAPFTYNTHLQDYDPGANATTLKNHINAGVSSIAYAGHGGSTSFVTTGFSNTNVNQLTNGTKLPFIVSVACVNGAFHESNDCFAEAWLKKENGGAVVTLMSSINQAWTPPMRIQDYFYDILTGGFDYSSYSGQNGITTDSQIQHWGSIVVNAFNLGLTETNSGNSDVETVKTWTTFGDVSLQLRTKKPDVILSSNSTLLVGIPFTTTITCSGSPIANALVCISQNNVYYSAFTNQNGEVEINHTFVPGEVLLVVTAFNKTTIYENINCISPELPYIVKDSYTLAGDGILTFGETTYLTLFLKNVGTSDLEGTTNVTISCSDTLLTINTATAIYPTIASGNTVSVANAFNISVSTEIENGHNFPIHFIAENDGNTWEGDFYLIAYKPVLEFDNVIWIGSFEVGTTIPLLIKYKNVGGYTAFNSVGTLTCSNPNINILNPDYYYGSINPNEDQFGIFNIEIAPTATINDVFEFTANIIADNNITAEGEFSIANTFACDVIVEMMDTWGDGWNAATLVLSFSDATPNKTLTMPDGYSLSHSLVIAKGTTVTVSFTAGQYNSECSYIIRYDNGDVIYASSGTPTVGIDTTFESNCGDNLVLCGEILNFHTIYQNPNVELTWDADEMATSFVIKRNGLQIATTSNTFYTDENVSGGFYTYTISTNYTNGDCFVFPVFSTINILCETPFLTAELSENNIILTWNNLECAEYYNVYLNSELLNSNIIDTTFIHENYPLGNLCYRITAVNVTGESELSNEVCINTVGFNENANFDVKMYPNPTSGNVAVNMDNLKTIEIYSTLNLLVNKYEINSNHFNFNISNLANGVYFVKIISENGFVFKKLIKQ
ncbi:MAG: C25 family cysteine peptidase [Bacteroidales bacterium]|jgi:gingipain R|nr:C25 family cysteine peptidase [Bacteroidales bacterium]